MLRLERVGHHGDDLVLGLADNKKDRGLELMKIDALTGEEIPYTPEEAEEIVPSESSMRSQVQPLALQ